MVFDPFWVFFGDHVFITLGEIPGFFWGAFDGPFWDPFSNPPRCPAGGGVTIKIGHLKGEMFLDPFWSLS
jgi:hypothetical protein